MSSEDLDGLKPGQFLAKFKKSGQAERVLMYWEDFEAKQVHTRPLRKLSVSEASIYTTH